MWFAALIDFGLIPFLAFTAVLCQVQYTTGQYGWETLFGSQLANYDIIFATFIASASFGGLHLISLIIDIWLAIIFRKIAALPPGERNSSDSDRDLLTKTDMNPLEDNLTARPHKRNKSEFTIEDKHLSQTSLPSTITNGRSEATDPLITPPRTVPFMHTRNGSSDNLTTYRQNTGLRDSHADLPATNRPYQHSNGSFTPSRTDMTRSAAGVYNQPNHSRTSQMNLNKPISSQNNHPRPGSAGNRTGQYRPNSPSKLRDQWNHPLSTPYGPINDENVQPTLPAWPLQEEIAPPAHEAVDIREWYTPPQDRKGRSQANKDYVAVPSQEPEKRQSNLYDFDRDLKTPKPNLVMSPLGMNPPSPNVYSSPESLSPPPREPRRIALSDADVNLPAHVSAQQPQNTSSSNPSGPNRASSFVGSGTKSKYYGDVMNFSRGQPVGREKSGRSERSDRSEVNGGADSASVYSTSDADYEGNMNLDGKGRVISNSGYDLNTGYAGLGPEFGKGMASRRREVSGKIAEEGRGYIHITEGPGAAGWARFKGL